MILSGEVLRLPMLHSGSPQMRKGSSFGGGVRAIGSCVCELGNDTKGNPKCVKPSVNQHP